MRPLKSCARGGRRARGRLRYTLAALAVLLRLCWASLHARMIRTLRSGAELAEARFGSEADDLVRGLAERNVSAIRLLIGVYRLIEHWLRAGPVKLGALMHDEPWLTPRRAEPIFAPLAPVRGGLPTRRLASRVAMAIKLLVVLVVALAQGLPTSPTVRDFQPPACVVVALLGRRGDVLQSFALVVPVAVRPAAVVAERPAVRPARCRLRGLCAVVRLLKGRARTSSGAQGAGQRAPPRRGTGAASEGEEAALPWQPPWSRPVSPARCNAGSGAVLVPAGPAGVTYRLARVLAWGRAVDGEQAAAGRELRSSPGRLLDWAPAHLMALAMAVASTSMPCSTAGAPPRRRRQGLLHPGSWLSAPSPTRRRRCRRGGRRWLCRGCGRSAGRARRRAPPAGARADRVAGGDRGVRPRRLVQLSRRGRPSGRVQHRVDDLARGRGRPAGARVLAQRRRALCGWSAAGARHSSATASTAFSAAPCSSG